MKPTAQHSGSRFCFLALLVTLVSLLPAAIAQASTDGNLTAFQANTGHLFTYSDGESTDTNLGMMPGTSPGTTANSDEIAFQAYGGDLGVTSGAPFTWTDTHLGMRAGTSPSMAAFPSGAYEVAFQANTTELYTFDPNGGGTDTHQGMMPGTSPSITAIPAGYVIAFQANTGELYTYEICFCASNGVSTDTHQGMMAGTSPSIAALPSGGYLIAFQTNTGDLKFTSGAPYTGTDTHLGMMRGTSPSIAALPPTGWEIAFQANTSDLYNYDVCFCSTNGSASDSHMGMMAGTSPSIAAIPDGGSSTSFQANTGHFYTYGRCFCSVGGATDTQQGMAGGTSPSAPVPTDTLYPDESVDADPGQSVTAIMTDPGCTPDHAIVCKSVINVANVSGPLTSAQQAQVDQDMATAQGLSDSQAFDASAGTQIVVTRTIDTTGTAASCSRGCTRYAYDHLCAFRKNGCSVWAQHTNERFWYNGAQAWGGPGVNGSWIDCSNHPYSFPITGMDETQCWFHPDGGPWHNPAYASRGQHLSADNRFAVHYWLPLGFSTTGFHHIYFWDFPSGKVKYHIGNGY